MIAEPITSAFKTPRPCCICGREFIPEKRADRRINEFCPNSSCKRTFGRRLLNPVAPIERQPERVKEESTTGTLAKVTALPVRKPGKNGGRNRSTVVPLLASPADDDRFALAMRVKGYRLRRTWTHAQLAARIGMSERGIQEMESGRRDIRWKIGAALAREFGLSMDELYYGTGRAQEQTP